MQKPHVYTLFFILAFIASSLLAFSGDREWMKYLGVVVVIFMAGLGVKLRKD